MSDTRTAHDDLVLAEAVLLGDLPGLDETALLRLAEHGRQLRQPPAFRGRCLEPAYLDAVARGTWSADDESRLFLLLQRAESETVLKVRRRYRRGLLGLPAVLGQPQQGGLVELRQVAEQDGLGDDQVVVGGAGAGHSVLRGCRKAVVTSEPALE